MEGSEGEGVGGDVIMIFLKIKKSIDLAHCPHPRIIMLQKDRDNTVLEDSPLSGRYP